MESYIKMLTISPEFHDRASRLTGAAGRIKDLLLDVSSEIKAKAEHENEADQEKLLKAAERIQNAAMAQDTLIQMLEGIKKISDKDVQSLL